MTSEVRDHQHRQDDEQLEVVDDRGVEDRVAEQGAVVDQPGELLGERVLEARPDHRVDRVEEDEDDDGHRGQHEQQCRPGVPSSARPQSGRGLDSGRHRGVTSGMWSPDLAAGSFGRVGAGLSRSTSPRSS
jgi:hypothetical protein